MATYTLTTTTRQDEALAYRLALVNRLRADAGQAPFRTVQEMLSDDFVRLVGTVVSQQDAAERPQIADAYEAATAEQRAAARTALGMT